ncbi:MAG: recombination-associated protein RdgC [Desulfuromonadales bacterium]
MGLLANSVSLCQFHVVGDLPAVIDFEWAQERLARQGFRSIDHGSEEMSIGWVHLDDAQESTFDTAQVFFRDHYLTFSLRRDQRRIPGPLLRSYVQQAQDEFLRANPGMKRVPKQKREELREAVRDRLLARVLPSPSIYDAVWDTRRGVISLSSLNANTIELFEGLFRTTFDNLRLVPVHPFARAESVLEGDKLEALRQANRASGQAVLDLIKDNQWLGADFLLWLMHRSMNGSGEFRTSRPGPGADGEPFAAWLDDRMILLGDGETGVQKVTVVGPQGQYREACTALRENKRIIEATMYLEKGENAWRLTLKGETFHFASLKSPGVKLEKDDLVDAAAEREAVFFERMYLIESALQMFDTLYADFLRERLGRAWSAREEEIRDFLSAA